MRRVERAPEVMDAETVYEGRAGEVTVRTRSFSSASDRAPAVELSAARPVRMRVTVAPAGDYHYLRPGRARLRAEGASWRWARPRRWLLLEHEAHLEPRKEGQWDSPERWTQFNSMVLVAADPAPDEVQARAEGGVWRSVELTWRRAERARVYVAPFYELDPADCGFVFRAAEHVARDGRFGGGPYLPARTSTAFMGAVQGLAAAAWMLDRFHHPDAAGVNPRPTGHRRTA